MRKIAVIPVYNEESTLRAVLESLVDQVDMLVVVDDGSSDRSLDIARQSAAGNRRIQVLSLGLNRGMSAALREGFHFLACRLKSGELDADDLVDSREIGALGEYVRSRGLDVALTRRDFGLYPFHKRLGNLLMTLWGSLWSGFRYRDVESGFRAMRLKVLPVLMEYFTGHRYSCAQEIAVLTARLGFRVDNEFTTVIQLYRSQTGLRDVLINAAFGAWACIRWALGRKVGERPALARMIASGETRG